MTLSTGWGNFSPDSLYKSCTWQKSEECPKFFIVAMNLLRRVVKHTQLGKRGIVFANYTSYRDNIWAYSVQLITC